MFLGLACLALAPATLLAATLTATLDRDTVTVGESATLTLVFEGGSPKNPPALPRLQNLRATFGGQSSQFSWNNGVSASSVTYTYSLTPVQPGDFTLPPIQAEVDGKILNSPPITLRAARAAAAQPDAAGAGDQIALLKLVLPKKQIYLGEVVPLEVQLYVRDAVQNIQQFQMSPFNADGFAFGKTVQGGQRQARIGNANFSVVPFQTTVTAVKPGALKIEPVDFSMVIMLPVAGQRQRDPFDPFGMFQQRGEQRRITLSTEAETVEVLPLPAGAPADFGGAVGNFSLTMTAAPTDVAAGDPITVKAQITGRGALDAVNLPLPAAWQDFKTYPPSSKVQTTDQLGLQGVKHFELVVVPQSAEVKQLPPLTFTFFDPEQKTYRTLTQPAVALKVRPGAVSAMPALAAKQDNSAPAQDI
ncbi:MAG: BatD family protein, partial [Verrucomicrobia bacterium]|nr:BatD family protein [Verrucomicrobiota bacterium]